MNGLDGFYTKLPKHSINLIELYRNENLFNSVPDSWYVVHICVTPISTKLTKNHYKDINLATTGAIITVLNSLKQLNNSLTVPYFFGGSSSTFIIPDTLLVTILNALKNYKHHINRVLDFDLNFGHVSIGEICGSSQSVKIAKLRHNEFLTTPIILGNGLKLAEKRIKDRFEFCNIDKHNYEDLNLEGLECRWDDILPANPENKIICLLVKCNDESEQAKTFAEIIGEIEYLFGDLKTRNPITTSNLKLDNSIGKIRKEMLVRLGQKNNNYLASNWLITLFGTYYFKFFTKGKKYLYKVTQLSDTLKLDGTISTVISGHPKQINKLTIYLDNLESNNAIEYSMHITRTSIMSCYVQDRDKNHVHFIDGAEGGHSAAELHLFKKSKNRNT